MRSFFASILLLLPAACGFLGADTPEHVVYFQARSAELDQAARGVIANAARQAQQNPQAPVNIVGYTDSAGSPQADVVLSRRRAQAVADALVAGGVPASRLVRLGRGQTGADPGLASRRVEIWIGGL
jgi:outer membrane protein OmpA-like peptidoglycan-associated protein